MFRKLLRLLFGSGTPAEPGPRPPSSTQNRDLEWNAASSTDAAVSDPAAAESASRREAAGPSVSGASSALSGLDTDKFAPLSVDEALHASGTADWRSAYYDSLHVIPPADLPRIQVIDRTMVGLGLISEDELAEIHDVGREMAAYRNEHEYLRAAADRAVAESRNARLERRKQKKAESAARHKARQKAIAERRARGIDFLGRGVSRGLADHRSNIERLQQNDLPLLSTPAELANAMGISVPELRWLAFHSEAPSRTHYVTFGIPKKSGGVRTISTPHIRLAHAQQWILNNVLKRLAPHDAAHGFVGGRSVLSNAIPHVNAHVVVNVDLADFFPSITFARVDGLLRAAGYSPAVATVLALLCTECPRQPLSFQGATYHAAVGPRALPQGACTSPALSNLIARRLDLRLSGMAEKLGWNYTRYADDITWSIQETPSPSIGYILSRIRHIVDDEGFELNHSKTRVLRRNQRQSVTGVTVNDQPGIPRATIRRVRSILHNAKRTGLAAQNVDNHPYFESWLLGMIGWIQMVNPKRGRQLRSAYEELQPE